MGGGTDYSADVPRKKTGGNLLDAVAALRAVGAANGGSSAADAEFCARTHEVPFEITANAQPAPGDAVRLDPSSPPSLVNGGGPIGILHWSIADALSVCLALDWKMAGVVEQVDPSNRTGIATLTGAR